MTLRIGKAGNKLYLAFMVVSAVSLIICMETYLRGYEYPFWILPGAYLLLSLICYRNRKSIRGNPGAIVVNSTMFIRYNIVPMIICVNRSLSRFADNYSYINPAIWLMVYEMCAVFIALEATEIKQKKGLRNNIEETEYKELLHLNNGFLIATTVLIITIGIGIIYKDFQGGFAVILSGTVQRNVNKENSNIINIIWEVLCVWLFVHMIHSEKEKYLRDNSIRHATKAIVYTFLFILISFIESVSLSRWYTIISACTALACIIKLFPKYKKGFFLTVAVPALIFIVIITVYKNGGYRVGSGSSFTESFRSLFDPTMFDIYFAGPVDVNNAIGMKSSTNLGISCIFRDALNNMPIINHYMDITATSVYAYNNYIHRLWGLTGDNIIPLIGQSATYFGYLLSPLLSVLSVFILRKADYKFNSATGYSMYVHAFIAIWYGVVFTMLNLTINTNWLYIRIIPFALALTLTDRISRKLYYKIQQQQQ